MRARLLLDHGLTELEEVHSSLVTSDVEVVVQKSIGLEPQLREVVTPIITQNNEATGFEELYSTLDRMREIRSMTSEPCEYCLMLEAIRRDVEHSLQK